MQAALIRLTGPTRGVVDVFDEEAVRLGTDQSNEIALEAHHWPMVVPFHAEIRQKDGSFLLVDVSFAGLWVNGQKVSQIFLTDGDTIQLGDAGPQFRFRTHLKRDQRRSFPAILSDTGAVSRAGGDAARVSATEFVKHLALALVREVSWTARVGVIGGLLLVLSFLIAVPIFLVRGYRVTEETQQEVTALAARLREERFSREELSTRVETEQEVLARQQSALAALEEERRRLRSALSETEKKLRRA